MSTTTEEKDCFQVMICKICHRKTFLPFFKIQNALIFFQICLNLSCEKGILWLIRLDKDKNVLFLLKSQSAHFLGNLTFRVIGPNIRYNKNI